jgi:CheY-like chemotaxis protein
MRTAERTGTPRLSGARALVVDDEADARDLMRYVLETRGAHVSVAMTTVEALDLLGRETFDVLIADLGMPEQDGYALIRAIRALPESRGSRIPAIAVTAYASRRDRDQALTAGYNFHLAKPVGPDALIRGRRSRQRFPIEDPSPTKSDSIALLSTGIQYRVRLGLVQRFDPYRESARSKLRPKALENVAVGAGAIRLLGHQCGRTCGVHKRTQQHALSERLNCDRTVIHGA